MTDLSTEQVPAAPVDFPNRILNAIPEPMTRFFSRVLVVMEYIGETVAGIIGLDESKFQYVIDSMDAEEWRVAEAVHAERLAQEQVSAMENANDHGDATCASTPAIPCTPVAGQSKSEGEEPPIAVEMIEART